MRIIHMIDDFKILCEEKIEMGNFEAYRKYTKKYPELFDGIFRGLYMTELKNLIPMIDSIDFQQNFKIAKQNYDNNIVQKIIETAKEVALLLNFKQGFDVYLGLELGNIGGFAGPNPKGSPFIYIGLDRVIDKPFLNYIVPHEMNHMVRIHANENINLFDFRERTITEGLGSLCPIILYNMDYSINTISTSLSIPNKEVRDLIDNRDLLINEITEQFGTPLNEEKMKRYFTWSNQDENDKYYLSGYYVGMEIIKDLMGVGYNFDELTTMPSKLIWEEYKYILCK